ncbi:hypothetical protein HDU67_009218 [Dinochytrium kinnereticum]|nr:hypothetical protein HDU67_009218 [Dinochytrium kinnereticum]
MDDSMGLTGILAMEPPATALLAHQHLLSAPLPPNTVNPAAISARPPRVGSNGASQIGGSKRRRRFMSLHGAEAHDEDSVLESGVETSLSRAVAGQYDAMLMEYVRATNPGTTPSSSSSSPSSLEARRSLSDRGPAFAKLTVTAGSCDANGASANGTPSHDGLHRYPPTPLRTRPSSTEPKGSSRRSQTSSGASSSSFTSANAVRPSTPSMESSTPSSHALRNRGVPANNASVNRGERGKQGPRFLDEMVQWEDIRDPDQVMVDDARDDVDAEHGNDACHDASLPSSCLPMPSFEIDDTPHPMVEVSKDKLSATSFVPTVPYIRVNTLDISRSLSKELSTDRRQPTFSKSPPLTQPNPNPRTVSVGLTEPMVVPNKHPGGDPKSYGYIGEDGSSMNGAQSTRMYGPRYGCGDVVGCGYVFEKGTIFFTLNGKMIATAFERVMGEPLFACVGMHHPSESVRMNFGGRKFAFDLDKFIMEQKKVNIPVIFGTPLEPIHVQDIVSQYLLFCGPSESDQLDLITTKPPTQPEIRRKIMSGDMATARSLITRHHLTLLKPTDNDTLQTLQLLFSCQEVIERVRVEKTQKRRKAFKRARSGDRLDLCDETELVLMDMRIDGGIGSFGREIEDKAVGDGERRSSAKRNSCDTDDDDQEDGPSTTEGEETDEFATLLSMKNVLSPIFQRLKLKDPSSQRVALRLLQDVSGLIAYDNPFDSPLRGLLDEGLRERVAEAVNTGILGNGNNTPPRHVTLTTRSPSPENQQRH